MFIYLFIAIKYMAHYTLLLLALLFQQQNNNLNEMRNERCELDYLLFHLKFWAYAVVLKFDQISQMDIVYDDVAANISCCTS